MMHYVLLKFRKGADVDAAEKLVRSTYEKLAEVLPYLSSPVTYRCCVERDSNADIMAVMRLDSADKLQEYLHHPLHVGMGKQLNPSIETRISFDRPD